MKHPCKVCGAVKRVWGAIRPRIMSRRVTPALLLRLDALPPEAKFNNVEDMLGWLESDKEMR